MESHGEKSVRENSDRALLELLRQDGGLGIQELTERLSVTPTAVRQRLDRLSAAGLLVREEVRGTHRGRPAHRYLLSEAGLKALDRNMVELARVLWDEIQQISDDVVRQGILARISSRLAEHYTAIDPARSVTSPPSAAEGLQSEVARRLELLAASLREKKFPASIEPDPNSMLPVLKINGCPFPDLSGSSHEICDVEAAMLSQLLGHELRLRHCRCDSPDGGCVFEVAGDALVGASPGSPVPCTP